MPAWSNSYPKRIDAQDFQVKIIQCQFCSVIHTSVLTKTCRTDRSVKITLTLDTAYLYREYLLILSKQSRAIELCKPTSHHCWNRARRTGLSGSGSPFISTIAVSRPLFGVCRRVVPLPCLLKIPAGQQRESSASNTRATLSARARGDSEFKVITPSTLT